MEKYNNKARFMIKIVQQRRSCITLGLGTLCLVSLYRQGWEGKDSFSVSVLKS